MRGASPSMSGMVANSTNRTRTTPSAAGIGFGNGSVGAWASALEATSTAAATPRIIPAFAVDLRTPGSHCIFGIPANYVPIPVEPETGTGRWHRHAVDDFQWLDQ